MRVVLSMTSKCIMTLIAGYQWTRLATCDILCWPVWSNQRQ